MLGFYRSAERIGSLAVGPDVLYACFVECDVGLAESEEVEGQGLGGFAGWCVDWGRERGEGAVDWGGVVGGCVCCGGGFEEVRG